MSIDSIAIKVPIILIQYLASSESFQLDSPLTLPINIAHYLVKDYVDVLM